MRLPIERVHVEALAGAFPELAFLRDQLRFGNVVSLPLGQLSAPQLAYLGRRYESAGPALATQAAQLRSLERALGTDTRRFAAGDPLEMLLPALVRYLAADARHGWLFGMNAAGKPLAYLVTRIDYIAPSSEEMGKVMLELKANAKRTIVNSAIRISAGDLPGRTVGEILLDKGYLKETPELLQAYEASAERYFEWRGRYGEQFSASGIGFYAEDPNATHRDTDWARKDVVVLSSSGGAARLVNDEGILPPRTASLDASGDILGAYLRKAAKSNLYDAEAEMREIAASLPPGMFRELPVHGYIFMFHLELHHYLWVHVDDIRPYEYQPALKQKLVLPGDHTELIDILTAEMDVLADDIVAGKSGGTTVLCAGPPGVGKTLTAEVYAEIIRRPLYRVHSGQLGLSVGALEAALKDVLVRAQRWGAVMLIDEADVYIKRREDDIAMNAVVGVFLRVLEYFNGLLFLTTNRVDDIDEAIFSRCIALIKYTAPDGAARRRIWQVMAEQFGLELDAPLLDELVELFPAASGRDIKGLAKLVAKYSRRKGIEPGLDTFRRCALFRALDAAPAPAPASERRLSNLWFI